MGSDNDPAEQVHSRTENPSRVSDYIDIYQINIQHNKTAAGLLCKQIAELHQTIVLIQEPWSNKNKILGFSTRGITLFRSCSEGNPRTCVITKGLQAYCLPQYSNRDQTAVCVTIKSSQKERSFIVASVYMPIEVTPPSTELEQLVHYCNTKNLPLIIGADTNAHHLWWGSHDCNQRGYMLSEYLATTDLEIANQGNEPTFCVRNKRTVIDVTLVTRSILQEIHNWHVVSDDTFSDHRKIFFTIKNDKQPPYKRRNVKRTDWDTYQTDLSAKVGMWIGSLNTPADIERELNKLNSAITSSFEHACPERKCSGRTKVPWWNHELRCLRQKANKAFHKAYKSGTNQDWDQHRATRRAFKKALRRNKRQEWHNFCTRTESIHESARLYKVLGRSPTVTLGMLRLPNGQWTSNLEEAYLHLLETHFPGSHVEHCAKQDNIPRWLPPLNFAEVKRIITEDRVRWAIESMAPFKSPGKDGIYPVLLQKGLQSLLFPVCKIYQASLTLGYIPLIWREARVTFLPKPGKDDYTTAKAFRPISLTSFLLKGLEKVVDRYLRDGPLLDLPIHPRQHAFQAGKSTESALHHLVNRIEKALDAGQYALGVFFDIQGAFDNTPLVSVRRALRDRNVSFAVQQWISALLSQRKVGVNVGSTYIRIKTQCGLPQGGGLSPTLWSLVADSLLKWLSKQGVFAQGFADDGVVLLIGKALNILCEVMQRTLHGVQKWCMDRHLSVNPSKTEMILFTRKYKPDSLSSIYFYQEELEQRTQVKYLGVILDSKLNWSIHIDVKCNKALISLNQLRRSIGKTWGLTPRTTRWIYTAIIRPSLTYAAVVWWPRVKLKTAGRKLEHLQRLACLFITGALRTTPTKALEIIVDLLPLPIFIMQTAMLACIRLRVSHQWVHSYCGHTVIQTHLEQIAPLTLFRGDKIVPSYTFDNNYVICIPNKDDWQTQSLRIPDDIVCYTDGSRLQKLGRTGASVYNQTTDSKLTFPLGRYSTIFQAEIYAILACVYSLSNEHEASIAICSDSQAALKALRSAKTKSSLVAETKTALRKLSTFNSVRLLWVPGHSNVPGNEIADELAKQAAISEFIGPEPVLRISSSTAQNTILSWAHTEHYKLWKSTTGCRQAKMFLQGPDRRLARFALGLNRKHLSILTGLLTGHVPLNRHLTVMKLRTDPLCPKCGEEEETAYHFLGKCSATMMVRYSVFGVYLMEPGELQKVQLHTLLRFVRASRRFI